MTETTPRSLKLGMWILLFAICTAIISYLIIPKAQSANASVSKKCQLDLKRINDQDKFCDATDSIQSHKGINEAERRASLTRLQRCQEDHKTVADPESGDTYYVFCHIDGTYDVKTADELQSQAEQDMADYYSSLQDN